MSNDINDHNRGRPESTERHLSLETLSAYADGQLSAKEQTEARTHLGSCAFCQEELRGLRATTMLMRSLPELQPTRSFQLGPEYAKKAGPETAKVGWLERLLGGMPALRTATAAVALLLVVVVAGDVLTNNTSNNQRQAVQVSVPTSNPVIVAPATNTAEAATLFQSKPTAPESAEPTLAAPEAPAVQQKEVPTEEAQSEGAPADAASGGSDRATAADEAQNDQIQAAGAAAPAEMTATPEPTSTATPYPTATLQPTATIAPTSTATAVPATTSGMSNNDERNWRIAEIALSLLLAWLIVTWIGLKRLRRD
jgi:anti-sigma factor RsiW